MPDMEKVINGIEACLPSHDPECDLCPYDSIDRRCRAKLRDDVVALLKAQEPVKPTWKNGYPLCGECGFKLHWIIEQNNYCANCGRAVKWE